MFFFLKTGFMLQGVLGKKLLFLVHIPMFYNVEKTAGYAPFIDREPELIFQI